MKKEFKNIAEAKKYFYQKLLPIWGEETSELFFIWWNEKKGWTRSEIQLNIEYNLSESEIHDLTEAIARLQNSEPIQYVIGSVPFAGCKINVNPSVLIPRPETEELVYLMVEKMKNFAQPQVLDLCTGSGCIALGLKFNRSDVQVTATDVSQEALQTAHESAVNLQLNITWVLNNILQDEIVPGKFHVIVSNPPYIPISDKSEMHANVLEFEPHLALFVPDQDPLIFYRKIIEKYSDSLADGGFFAFEIHEKLAEPVMKLLSSNASLHGLECIRDMQEKPRMIFAVKKH